MPGDAIAVSEEFVGGGGTAELADGTIVATRVGAKCQDSKSRLVSVRSKSATRFIEPGDEVFALVQDLYDSVALLQFEAAEPKGVHVSAGNTYAYLRISEVQRGYVDNFRDVLRIGDFVRARIKEVTPLGIYLTIMAPDLGVVKASCSRCRTFMERKGRVFACPSCGSKESRKAAAFSFEAGAVCDLE